MFVRVRPVLWAVMVMVKEMEMNMEMAQGQGWGTPVRPSLVIMDAPGITPIGASTIGFPGGGRLPIFPSLLFLSPPGSSRYELPQVLSLDLFTCPGSQDGVPPADPDLAAPRASAPEVLPRSAEVLLRRKYRAPSGIPASTCRIGHTPFQEP
ncbi:conserved hypothetical protein [Trichophyton verrucosum HKI 0517]|uniref:Uncharacterized protein n=1 Tax=Trichophyton verrucosum (strain HKI 0517) TaxID=663202 RepID=D4DC80_TRIVH|nr:uncharacterized protein TRV_08209 [Trichophyton verrucosum HKI 0517]EFE40542.1 conserved hypothetical protein [Trichophyton verrucosum HKI 0517]